MESAATDEINDGGLRWILRDSLNRHGERLALQAHEGSQRISYGLLARLCTALEGRLSSALGGLAGKSVALLADDFTPWVVSDLTLMLGGALEIVVPASRGPEQATHLFAVSDACLVSHPAMAQRVKSLAPDLPVLLVQVTASGCELHSLSQGRADKSSRRWTRLRDGTAAVKLLPLHPGNRARAALIGDDGLGDLVDALAAQLRSSGSEGPLLLSRAGFASIMEQVAGLYLPLALGATVVSLPDGVTEAAPGCRSAEYLRYLSLPWLAEICSRTRDVGAATSIRNCARALGTSTRTLQRRLAEQGLRFQTLVRASKVLEAAGELLHGNDSATEVAMNCGFADSAHLTREFRRFTGVTPSGFRRLTCDIVTLGRPGAALPARLPTLPNLHASTPANSSPYMSRSDGHA